MRPFWLAPMALAGCSLIYNPDDLRHDAGPPPDAVPIDSNPSDLALTSITPSTIDEGTGADHGRPALFVLAGTAITGGATITAVLDPDGTPVPLTPEIGINGDGSLAVIAVTIPVLGDLAAGDTRILRFTVSQAGIEDHEDATVNGLAELSDIASFVPGTTYSEITLGASHHFTGGAPIILTATGGITITGLFDLDAVGQTAGPGGCGGGDGSSPGGCGSAGGRQGANTTLLGAGDGGGGGGYGDTGTQGSGQGGGAPGVAAGNDMLVPILTTGNAAGNRGAGGGGGGMGTLGAGGVGGGGGGVIEVEAGGDLSISTGVRAQGGSGVGGNGGGGGGSGGAILLRAGGSLSAGSVTAPAGLGAAGATNPGGDGSFGRIRIDASAPTASADPPAIRGPAWDAATPTIVHTKSTMFTLHGQPARALGVRLGDAEVDDVSIGAGGTGTITIDLDAGLNHICALYTSNGMATQLSGEAVSCIDVGYAN